MRRFSLAMIGLAALMTLSLQSIHAQSDLNIPYVTSVNDLGRHNFHFLTVKFDDGTDVRLREAALTSLSGADVSGLDSALAAAPIVSVERLFTRPETVLAQERLDGIAETGVDLPDLNLYYAVRLDDSATVEQSAAVLSQLNALEIVEIAYAEPYYSLAMVDIPPTTPNLTAQQGYVNPAPNGINRAAAWAENGRGSGVRVVSIEGGWQIGHEDLPLVAGDLIAGINFNDAKPHGTAVAGVIAGLDNGYGITGIAPDVSYKGVSVFGTGNLPSIANAINIAVANTNPGDIIIYELQAMGPPSGGSDACGLASQYGQIAMEYWQANFDATVYATSAGRVVLEVAGNGQMNLDHARYGGAFNRAVRDSGAILVGAGTPNGGLAPTCWTNYGSRVDVQAWGDGVVSTGLGDLFNGGGDANQFYTSIFSGTSSASAITAGGVADLQSIAKARVGYLTSQQMRQLIRDTGTAQAASSKQIGPMINLATAVDRLISQGVITGTVRAANGGAVVPSMIVRAQDAANPANWSATACSNGSGVYAFNDAPLGRAIVVSAGGLSNPCGGATNLFTEYWLEANDLSLASLFTLLYVSRTKSNVNFTLDDATTASGVIYELDGSTPIVDAQVGLVGTAYTTCTDGSGNFTLQVAIGASYRIYAGGYSTLCSEIGFARARTPSFGVPNATPITGKDLLLKPVVWSTVNEQELYQAMADEIATNPAITQIGFALVDFKTTGEALFTIRLKNGTVGIVTMTMRDGGEGVAILSIGGMTVNGATAPSAFRDVIQRELPTLVTESLDALYEFKVGTPRDLEELWMTAMTIEASFSQ